MGTQSLITHRLRLAALYLLLLAGGAASARAQTSATAVPLLLPTNIALDTQGNLYIAETGHHVVRRVGTSGVMTTVAGSGTQGFGGDGGAAVVALLDSPQGLAVADKTLYIADSHNHRVRRVDLSSGVITTVAGTGVAGFAGDAGLAVNATLDLPMALALDAAGGLLIADARNHNVRRVSSAATITTVAGAGVQGYAGDGGAASAALLDAPGGLAVDGAGNLYIADTHNRSIRRLDAKTGLLTTVKTSTAFLLPRGIAMDAEGNLLVADEGGHRVLHIAASDGSTAAIAGDGVQGFAGDGGTALSASLNLPTSVAASNGVVHVVDAGDARVRQIATNGQIQTVAGLGAVAEGLLTLTGATSVPYGSGQLKAMLSGSPATGSIVFLNAAAGSSTTLSTLPLQSNAAVLDLSTLDAGLYGIIATYAGDADHATTQSAQLPVTITPAPLTVAVTPTSVEYGAAIGTLQAAIGGVLGRDAGRVSASLATAASALSPAGSYPVVVMLNGAAAKNYTVAATPVLTIVPAATGTTLVADATSISAGQAVALRAHVAAATGAPLAGTVAIFDGPALIASGAVSSKGDLAVSTTSLGEGTHTLTALFLGNSNLSASASSAVPVTVSVLPSSSGDFTLATSGVSTQTVVAGGTATFTLTVQPQASLASQITLAASGLPAGMSASFNPGSIPPGAGATTVTFTVTTPKAALLDRRSLAALLALLIGLPLTQRRKSKALLLLPMLLLAGCGDRIATSTAATTAAKSYAITVTGTATGAAGAVLAHSASCTLVVVPSN